MPPRKLEVRAKRREEGRPATDPSSVENTEPENRHSMDTSGPSHEGIDAMESIEHSDSELPPLPSEHGSLLLAPDSSFDTSGDVGEAPIHSDGAKSLDEREMARQLSDFESSFLPDPAPVGTAGETVGADDTYINIGSPSHTSSLSSILSRPNKLDDDTSPPTPSDAYKTPAPLRSNHDTEDEEDEDSDVLRASGMSFEESHNSSPAAAAAQRGHSRITSTSTTGSAIRVMSGRGRMQSEVSDEGANPLRFPGDLGPNDPRRMEHPVGNVTRSGKIVPSHVRPPTPPHSSGYFTSTAKDSSPLPQDVSLPPSDTGSLLTLNGIHSLSPNRLQKRPSYLVSRHSSQRSSTSSQTITSDFSGSDATLNADYAIQTGGAIPANASYGSRPSMDLNRLPSLGSVASAITHDDEGAMPSFSRALSGGSILASLRGERALGRLDETRESLSPPVTPRASVTASAAPTDTVIAQHVQDIQVPDTIAQEYRRMHRNSSPDKRPSSSSNALTFNGRPRSNLTLKEQSSRIDKLTKENFDLKLKIHFLDQALQNRSDEGVKDMISKNVQLQTDLANERKEAQTLRRKIREMEKRLREQEEGLAEARRNSAGSEEEDPDTRTREELEEEIVYLSEELDRRQIDITKLHAENLAKEVEKRKMADYVSALSERKGNEQGAAEEESEMWKDLLAAETVRREQAEEDTRQLREELIALRSERLFDTHSNTSGRKAAYNKRRHLHTQSVSAASSITNSRDGAVTASTVTLVEQLRHENAELRRDLGAQTSMLTSRNRERERLQQEIEDLKLLQRKGDGTRSLAGDSIFERSISRAHQRSASHASGRTGMSQLSDTEREEWERREGALRDQNAALRLDYQELEREATAQADYITKLEQDCQNLDEDIRSAVEDLKALQNERDQALQALEDRDTEYKNLKQNFETLKKEAVDTIESLENDLEQSEINRNQLAEDLQNRDDDFRALQNELKLLSSSLVQLEDDRAASLKRIKALEGEIEDATQELEALDKKLREVNQKNQRLEVQSESLQSEVSFLREEQESDKIKIGDLENSLAAAQQAIQDEKEKCQELEQTVVEERRQREILDDQSKQEVQKVLNDLNTENAKAHDEVRRLRRNFSSKETEATTWKSRLEELESNLRSALGDINGTRTSFLQNIERLQNDLEDTTQQLERAKMDLSDKDRLLRNRDVLLESSGLESRRLSDLLDKERQARKHDLESFEKSRRGLSSNLRTIAQHETRVLELETARSQDRRKMANLEQQYRDQLLERNNLLLALWNRLSTLCGPEWSAQNSLVNGEVPSVDVIGRSLPAFYRNIVEAVKTVEGLIGSFKSRIRAVDKTLSRDYQTLSQNLEARLQRMDSLERAVKEAQAAIDARAAEDRSNQLRPGLQRQASGHVNVKSIEETTKLKQKIKVLEAELKFHRQHPSSAAQDAIADASRRQSLAAANAAANTLSPRAIAQSLLRHHSSSAIETLNPSTGTPARPSQQSIVIATPPIQPSEQRWIRRLKELERRLKAEREARLLDRKGARQRLEEKTAESEGLREQLEREKRRASLYLSEGTQSGEDVSEGAGHGELEMRRRREREGSVD